MAEHGPTGGLTPHLAIADKRASEAIDFYAEAFGATEQMRVPADDGVRLLHAHLMVNGASLMLHDEFPEYVDNESRPPDGVTLHLQVDDADAWFDRAVAAGATVIMPLDTMFWGDRYGQIKDPFGHAWSIGTPIKGEE
ncbi:MAG: VOC family protein [Sphingopyxis sp.]|nr:VOC family protein [Sphingopyxis sp.]